MESQRSKFGYRKPVWVAIGILLIGGGLFVGIESWLAHRARRIMEEKLAQQGIRLEIGQVRVGLIQRSIRPERCIDGDRRVTDPRFGTFDAGPPSGSRTVGAGRGALGRTGGQTIHPIGPSAVEIATGRLGSGGRGVETLCGGSDERSSLRVVPFRTPSRLQKMDGRALHRTDSDRGWTGDLSSPSRGGTFDLYRAGLAGAGGRFRTG